MAHRRLHSPGGTEYYVDAERGDDNNPGTSPRSAWKTIARVGQTVYAAGDRVLFAAGQTFPGTLRFTKEDSGVAGRAIIVSSFGRGRARIDGGAADGFTLTDCTFVTVRNLDFVGCGRKNGSDGAGIRLLRTHYVSVENVEVRGFRVAGIATGGDEDTRITKVHTYENGSAGIETSGGYGDVPRSKRLYIGDCLIENNPGDPRNRANHSGNGIVIGGVDDAVIEYCVATNNGWDMPREGNGPVGIWAWNADRVRIQHCISYENKSPGNDGGGFDFDGGVTNSILQYNLSYGNHGPGYLLCQYPGASPWRNNILRYNISIDDGAKNFQSGIGLWMGGDGISDAQIYNNTVVNPRHAVATLGALPGFVYRNNIFVAGGELLDGDFYGSRFENNLYWSSGLKPALPEEARRRKQTGSHTKGIYADPRLVMPPDRNKLPTDPRKLAKMPYYRLSPGSPGIGAGIPLPENGGRDLFGNRINATTPTSLGAGLTSP